MEDEEMNEKEAEMKKEEETYAELRRLENVFKLMEETLVAKRAMQIRNESLEQTMAVMAKQYHEGSERALETYNRFKNGEPPVQEPVLQEVVIVEQHADHSIHPDEEKGYFPTKEEHILLFWLQINPEGFPIGPFQRKFIDDIKNAWKVAEKLAKQFPDWVEYYKHPGLKVKYIRLKPERQKQADEAREVASIGR
jgi:hypothetical protein